MRGNEWIGATGKPLTSVLSIGIGGSCTSDQFSLSFVYSSYINTTDAFGK